MDERTGHVCHGRSEDGASAVEYGLLVAGIAALVATLVFVLGTTVSGSFGDSCSKMKSAATNTPASTCP